MILMVSFISGFDRFDDLNDILLEYKKNTKNKKSLGESFDSYAPVPPVCISARLGSPGDGVEAPGHYWHCN